MADPDHVLFLTSRLQERANRFLIGELHKKGIYGLEPSHGVILRQLYIRGPLSMSRLAELADRTKPTITVLVRKLLKHGFVKRVRDTGDRRVFMISLTDKAMYFARDLEKISNRMRRKVFTGFKPREKQELADLLERAIGNFEQ